MKMPKLMWWYFAVALAVLLALSYAGVMNNMVFPSFLGRTSALTAGQLPCNVASDCPTPKCFGSFNTADKSAVTLDSTEADKIAANLGNTWYDIQGNLKEVQCVEGKCQTSPFCIIEYSDITSFISQYPLQWVKEFPLLFIVLFAMLVLVIWATTGQK